MMYAGMKPEEGLERIPTGIQGFDFIAGGGLPRGRATIVAGTAGSAKTVLASQFLAEGIKKYGERGVFVTFEETAEDLRRNLASLGWPIREWEKKGLWAFVDASPPTAEPVVYLGPHDLSALISRVQAAIERIGATRVAVDSLHAAFLNMPDPTVLRGELRRLATALKDAGVTPLLTAERLSDEGPITQTGVEEFVADNVIILRNVLEEERRRRTVEILKMRGARHNRGQYTFTIRPPGGISVLPPAMLELSYPSTDERTTSGVPALDEMCGGGFFRDAVILASGATGTGKTLLTSEFLAGGIEQGERAVLFAFEESREQFFRNALGWGKDFPRMEEDGQLRVECVFPEATTPEELLVNMRAVLDDFRPRRIAVDSLSALERVSTPRGLREFVVALSSIIKSREVMALLTTTTTGLGGGPSATEQHISTMTDTIILLRYVEVLGEMRRGLTVLKMRGSPHDKNIREYTIDSTGIHIGRPFRNVSGILAGGARFVPADEVERIGQLFSEEEEHLPL